MTHTPHDSPQSDAPHSPTTINLEKVKFSPPNRNGFVYLTKKLIISNPPEMEQKIDKSFEIKRNNLPFFKKEQRRYIKRMQGNNIKIFTLPKKYHIVYTNLEEEFRKWINEEVIGKNVQFCGVDSEWSYYSPQNSPAEVIQIATEHSSIVFSTGGTFCRALLEFFEMHNVQKVFIGAAQDYSKICNSKVIPESVIDIAIGDDKTVREGRSPGAYELSKSILGLCLKKNPLTTLSRWSRDHLDDWQIEYAATDAYLNFLLFQNVEMRSRVERYGNSAPALYKMQDTFKMERSQKRKERKEQKLKQKQEEARKILEKALIKERSQKRKEHKEQILKQKQEEARKILEKALQEDDIVEPAEQ